MRITTSWQEVVRRLIRIEATTGPASRDAIDWLMNQVVFEHERYVVAYETLCRVMALRSGQEDPLGATAVLPEHAEQDGS